jgi:hypothetical protein
MSCLCTEFYKCWRCNTKIIWDGLTQDQRVAAIALAQAISKGGDIKSQIRNANNLKVDVCMIPDDIFLKC